MNIRTGITGMVLLVAVNMLAMPAWADLTAQEMEQTPHLRKQYEEQRENITHAGELRNSDPDTATMMKMRDAEIKKDDAVTSGK